MDGAMLLLVLAVAVLLGLGSSETLFPFPPINHAVLITEESVLKAFLLDPFIHTQNIVTMLTYSMGDDSYLSLYLGGIAEIFDDNQNPPIFLIYQQPKERISDATALLFLLLPPHSVFVNIQHGGAAIGLRSLHQIYSTVGRGPRVLYHMNHERPWSHDPSDAIMDYTFASDDELLEAYASFDLILRNYHYEPLQDAVTYVPVGAPHYNFLIGPRAVAGDPEAFKTPASKREVRCYFRGRLEYDHGRSGVSLADEEHTKGRRALMDLHLAGKLPGCVVEEFNPSAKNLRTGAETHRAYVDRMQTVALALCPLGNNPETFRLHEALEVGAIPVIVRTKVPERDFLEQALWMDYPGPVLESWDELPALLASLTDRHSDLDAVQAVLRAWYAQFRASVVGEVRGQLLRAFAKIRRRGEDDLDVLTAAAGSLDPQARRTHIMHMFGTQAHLIATADLSVLLRQEKDVRGQGKRRIGPDGRMLPINPTRSPRRPALDKEKVHAQEPAQVQAQGSLQSPADPARPTAPSSAGADPANVTARVNQLEDMVKELLLEAVMLRERVALLEEQHLDGHERK